MKLKLVLIVMCCLQTAFAGPIGIYQRGTIVRMRMSECLSQHSFMATMSGNTTPVASELCPEYTLLTEKVVYVIVGKMSNQLLPLAETTNFRFHKNELAVRVDDANHESRFRIKEMVLRPQWDSQQRRLRELEEEEQENADATALSAQRRH
jgi:hypothetical protein